MTTRLAGIAAPTDASAYATAPEVPTFDESGYPGFEITVWYGLCGPAKLPAPVSGTLTAAVAKALADSPIQPG